MKKTYNYIMLSVIVITIIYIFSNSITDMLASKEQTEAVTDAVTSIIKPLPSDNEQIYMVIRKLGHVFEFAILGIELSLLIKKFSIYPFFTVLVVGLVDESIQLLNDRSSRVQDIWIDLIGGIIGILVGLIICRIICKLLKKKQTNKEKEKTNGETP